MRFPVVLTLLVLAFALPAHAAKVRLAMNGKDQCTVASPKANGEEASDENDLGLLPSELAQFEKAGADADDRADNVKWVKWYTGRANLAVLNKAGQKNITKRIVKWAGCEEMTRFKEALFRDLFSDARLDCEGGKFLYRFRVVGKSFKMDLYQRSELSEDLATRFKGVEVKFTDTDSKTCPTRVVQTTPDGKEFKLCLQVSSSDKSKTTGQVGIKLPDTEIEDADRSLSCRIDERFSRKAKDLIAKESAPTAPASKTTVSKAPDAKSSRALN